MNHKIDDRLISYIEQGKKFISIDKKEIEMLESIPNIISPIIAKVCKKRAIPLKDIVPVGSSQRKTFLPGSRDIDIFVRLETKKREILEGFASNAIPDIARSLNTTFEVKYAENPYGIIHFKDEESGDQIDIDIVSTIYIKNEQMLEEALKISGMARTPFHSMYLKEKILGLETEVRLLKYWSHKKKIYRQMGFTGFICELLVIIFGTFKEILQNHDSICNLVFDFANRPEKKLRKLFNNHPMIIVDPIDKSRNAAGGIHGILGRFHLERFRKLAKESLLDPKTMWADFNLKGSYYKIKITFDQKIDIKNDDEKYSRLVRILGNLYRAFKENEIEILDSIISKSKSEINFVNKISGGNEIVKKGPPENLGVNVEKFKAKNPNHWLQDGFYWTRLKKNTIKNIVNETLIKISIIKNFELIAVD